MDKTINQFWEDCYLAFDKEGNTRVQHDILALPLYRHAFIRIKYQPTLPPSAPFTDPVFTAPRPSLISSEPIHFIRIADILPHSTPLFPKQALEQPVLEYEPQTPHFVYEIRHFDRLDFKKLFITQRVAKNGLYEVLVNREGAFQVEIVDDFAPFTTRDNKHLWGLAEPWQWVVAKVWAKIVGGYDRLRHTKPFEFIQTFTPNYWRYFNLSIEGRSFLKYYSDKVGKDCRILLKTKQEQRDNEIEACGLVGGALLYEVVEMCRFREKEKEEHHVLLKSTVAHQWTGDLSIFDQKFEYFFHRLKHKDSYQMSTSLLMNSPDFFNLFASAFVSPIQQKYPQFTDSFKVTAGITCLQFTVLTSGYLIFSLIPNESMRYSPWSSVNIRGPDSSKKAQRPESWQYFSGLENPRFKCFLSRARETRFVSTLLSKSKVEEDSTFSPLKYEMVDYHHSQSCGRGSAHPIELREGQYLFIFQTETNFMNSEATLQYISHERIRIVPSCSSQSEQRAIVEASILSICHQVPPRLLRSLSGGFIAFGEEYEALGFDFLAIRLSKQKKGRLLVQVDRKKLQEQGYWLAHERKEGGVQRIEMKGGQDRVFLLQRLNKAQYLWPPQAFRFFEEK